jgi:predicted HTH transcriptional regulator
MENSELQIREYNNDNDSSKEQGKQIAVHLPITTLNSLKKEFNISEADISSFITCLIDRAVAEHIAEANSKVFSDSEVKELEDDLKGLGYI